MKHARRGLRAIGWVCTAGLAVLVTWSTRGDSPDPEPLFVDWGGCVEVRQQGDELICIIDAETSLRLWIEAPRIEQVEVTVDGELVSVERYAIDGEAGGGLRVWVPEEATELVVRSTSSEARWSLALGHALSDRPPEELRRAKKDIKSALDDRDAARAGRAAERAFHLALQDGRLSQAVDVVLGPAFVLSHSRLDPQVVEGLLRLVEDAANRYPKGRGDLAAYRGLHRWYQGQTQAAAELLRDATRLAMRLDDEVLGADATPMYAETLAELGYFEDAVSRAREGLELVRRTQGACELGSTLRTVGWVNLLLRQRDHPGVDPRPFLMEALQVFGSDGPCPRPEKLGGARLSLALLDLEQRHFDHAARQLEQIDREKLTLDERMHVDDIHVRLALARGDAAGGWAAYEQLRRSVDAVDTAEARWRLHTRRGGLLEQDGNGSGAEAAYRAAERELDAIVRLQAVGIGRGELADRYHESTAALVWLLLQRDDVDEAWCIVREDQARRRTAAVAPDELEAEEQEALEEKLRRYRQEKLEAESLQEAAHRQPGDEAAESLAAAAKAHDRARALANQLANALGKLAPPPRCEDLTPPGDGELLVGLYPLERDWLIFASNPLETTVHVVSAPRLDRPELLADALLEPLGPRLDVARRVRVLAHREAQGIDVHGLPWGGEPLGARLPVSYGVELRARAGPPEPGYRALLVVDPTATLEGAEAEIEVVDGSLLAAGWATEVIERSDALVPSVVSLEGYDLFHYAGHAEDSQRPERGGWPPYPGGEAGWAGFLELGKAGRLTVHDVTTMSTVTRAVVLAGCRTGALELDTGQTSLALAFLVAGSEQVVASAEAVDDARGARFASGFYEALVHEPGVDLVAAMQQAQRGLWESGEELAGYRVWVR